ncbi:thioredoxin family protein [Porticoccaceae bacterium LTM1]|nr:thioredoxin family protein [Porticoccaceae bacterium LTM1]
MLNSLSKVLVSVCLVAFFSSALAEKGEQWLDDMDQAQKVAKEEGKNIFMYFTGSDWCGWCIKLDKEVLSKQEFLDYAKGNFVLVYLDFPMDEDVITEEQHAHNEKWKEVFKPRGYPAIYLTDASVNPFAVTGYQKGGAEAYVDHLKKIVDERDERAKLKGEIDKAVGIERARLLDQLFNTEGAVIEDRVGMAKEIITLSEGNDSELYNKYRNIRGNETLMVVSGQAQKMEPEQALEKLLSTFEEFSYITEGKIMERFVSSSIVSGFTRSGKLDDGIAFLSKVSSDGRYSIVTRQKFKVAQGFMVAENGDIESAKLIIKNAISMAPQTELAGNKDLILEKVESMGSNR